MVIIGIGFLSIPFIQSMNINIKQENDAWATCDLSDIAPGSIKECGYGKVYRRTQADKDSISKFAHLLDDPKMSNSEQPESASNKWRSENPDFFVFYPWAPKRLCAVEFKVANSIEYGGWKPPEYEALNELPFFIEPCESRTWDTSGRLYHRSNYPAEYNLIVPNVRWKTNTRILIPTPSF